MSENESTQTLAEAEARLDALERRIQVEDALERVRARAMAMQESDELAEAAAVVFEQLEHLGFSLDRVWFDMMNEAVGVSEIWMRAPGGQRVQRSFTAPLTGHPVAEDAYVAWKRKDPVVFFDLSGEALANWFQWIVAQTKGTPPDPLPARRVYTSVYFSYGWLVVASEAPLDDAQVQIMHRFAKVYDLTYTRFEDLQQAEAQVREAQIEAALERVRAKAMAMHTSEDLSATVSVVFRELKGLSVRPMRCGMGVFEEDRPVVQLWTTSESRKDDALELTGSVKLEGHPVFEEIYAHWVRQEEYHPVLQGRTLKSYYRQLKPHLAVSDWQDDYTQYGYFFYYAEGGLYAWTDTALAEEELRICRKFTAVLGLTYRRFLDLKEAEARAREAIQQASLDRVRAEIASMRTAADLERITPLVWRELTTLGVPFFRCGVFIMDEAAEVIHAYLSTPEGESRAMLRLPFDSTDTAREAVDHWRRSAVYRDLWDRNQYVSWMSTMLEQGILDESADYQGLDAPPVSLALQFVPFSQGMLYVGSAEPLAEDQVDLLQALAEAFAVAYARYEDFNRLEAAKADVEATLTHLKATQAQLIQAEKMASLGSLTAGIAHEIKNPLNFVNNFAEIVGEMVEELSEELEARQQDIPVDISHNFKEILADLKLNAEKINEHGRRADGIVRAMMQHARGGEGERRRVDVNALLEEYINLAYHGMRANTPDFNVTLEQSYEEGLGEVDMVPQEVGRVLINLFSNAFYAVNEIKDAGNGGRGNRRLPIGNAEMDYAPTVTLSTRSVDDGVEIRVQDNGPGIPKDFLEKIFEPFFTTKPTGQGTGLGLSLSYDIITQGHGGAMSVESEEGKGTTFIITLPN